MLLACLFPCIYFNSKFDYFLILFLLSVISYFCSRAFWGAVKLLVDLSSFFLSRHWVLWTYLIEQLHCSHKFQYIVLLLSFSFNSGKILISFFINVCAYFLLTTESFSLLTFCVCWWPVLICGACYFNFPVSFKIHFAS